MTNLQSLLSPIISYLIIAALLCSFPIAKLIEKAARKSAVAAYAVSVSKIAVNLSLILVSSIMLVDATNNRFYISDFKGRLI